MPSLSEKHNCLALTIPLRDLHRCVAREELDMDLIGIVVTRVSTSLATIDELLGVLL